MITKFDKPTCRQFRTDLERALAAFADEHGITLKVGNMKFFEGSCEVKLEAQVIGGDSKAAADFKVNAPYIGLKSEDLGQTFRYAGRAFKVTGLRGRSKKPILAESEDGKPYVFTAAAVIAGFGRVVPEWIR